MRPPRIEIVHHQLHHAVLRELGMMLVGLQDEGCVPDTKDHDLPVEKRTKAQRLIETPTVREVFGGEKRARGGAAQR